MFYQLLEYCWDNWCVFRRWRSFKRKIINLLKKKIKKNKKNAGIIELLLIGSGFIASLVGTIFLKYATNGKKYFDLIIKLLFLISILSFISLSILIADGNYFNLVIVTIVFLGIGGFGLQPFECEALEIICKDVQESLAVNGFYFCTNLIGLPLGLISTLPGYYYLF